MAESQAIFSSGHITTLNKIEVLLLRGKWIINIKSETSSFSHNLIFDIPQDRKFENSKDGLGEGGSGTESFQHGKQYSFENPFKIPENN